MRDDRHPDDVGQDVPAYAFNNRDDVVMTNLRCPAHGSYSGSPGNIACPHCGYQPIADFCTCAKSDVQERCDNRCVDDAPHPDFVAALSALAEGNTSDMLHDEFGPAAPASSHEAKQLQQDLRKAHHAAGMKENNPKDAFGVLKACMSWLPQTVIMELALAMAEGGFKYGGHNYLVAAPRSSVYTDGAHRHMYQYEYEGDLDEESKVGLHHISKAIASLVVLRAAQINGHWIDDRPPQAPKGWLASLNAKMVALAQSFPEPVARYLANGKRGPGRILP